MIKNSELVLDDIYDIWYTPWWKTTPGYLIIFILGLIVLGALFFVVRLLYQRYNQSYERRIIAKLKSLHKYPVDTQADQKKIYLSITQNLKKYIQSKYNNGATGKTDSEFIQLLESMNISSAIIEPVKILMIDSQTIKFAHSQTAIKQLHKNINEAIQFIVAFSANKNN